MPDAPGDARTWRARLPFFYGWVVVGTVFLVLMTAAGFGFYNATIYLEAVVSERGIPLGQASGATAMFFVSFGLAGLPISRLVATVDVRRIIVGGAVIGAVALALLGRVTVLWQLYAVFALFGVGFSACAFVPTTTVLTRWFVRRRALALTIATTGLSVGGIAITPATAAAIDRIGLAGVMPWVAGLWLLGIAPAAALLLVGSPGDVGLAADGGTPTAAEDGEADGVPTRVAIRDHYFQVLSTGFLLVFLTQVGVFAHLFPIALDQVGRGTASAVVSAVAMSSIVGRLAGAWVLERIAAITFTRLLAAVQAGSIVIFALAGDGLTLFAAAAAFGVTVGNLLVVVPVLLVDAYGQRDYAAIYSVNQLIATLGIAAGPTVIGIMRDGTGSYAVPLLVAAALCACSVVAFVRADPASAEVAVDAAE